MTSYFEKEAIEQKRLIRAEEAAVTTCELRPVIKEELRFKILSSRHAQGKPELKDLFEEPKCYKLTQEEEEKRERRRAQNREAAKRCREKRKRMQTTIDEEYEDECRKKCQLEIEVNDLRKQVSKMEEFLAEHLKSGTCKQQHFVNRAPTHASSHAPSSSFTQDLSNCTLEELDQPPDDLKIMCEDVDILMSVSLESEPQCPCTQENSDSVMAQLSTSHLFELSDLISYQLSDTPDEPTVGHSKLPGMDSFIKLNSYTSSQGPNSQSNPSITSSLDLVNHL